MKLIENILTLVLAEIQTNLDAKLLAIETEIADGIDLTPPMTESYAINELGAIDQLPFIQIVPDTSDIMINANVWDEMDHKIIIVAHTVSYEGKIDYCAKRTYRFARAIWEIMKANPTLTSTVITSNCTNIDYKPMMVSENGFKQEVWLNYTVKMNET